MKPRSAALASVRLSTLRGSATAGVPSGVVMSQNMRAVRVDLAAPRQDLERRGVGVGEHVGLVDAREALDRRAVEAEALGEGALDLGRGDRDRLERADDVGEPEPDELDAPLLDRAKNELLLAVHVPDPAAARGAAVGHPAPNGVGTGRTPGSPTAGPDRLGPLPARLSRTTRDAVLAEHVLRRVGRRRTGDRRCRCRHCTEAHGLSAV